MEAHFSKYSACGNDFIIFDNRSDFFPSDSHLIETLCHRHEGIGADGVILLESSSAADFKMVFFNADGSKVSMCGNGLRCLMAFIYDKKLATTSCTIETEHFIHKLHLDDEKTITVTMPSPSQQRWYHRLSIGDRQWVLHSLDTGVPHVVLFMDDISAINMNELGRAIRHHSDFSPSGTNVNVAHIRDDNVIAMRTYERGVEAETWACGTGATATAIAAAIVKNLRSPIKIQVRSGDFLTITFDIRRQQVANVSMTGPARRTFRGTFIFQRKAKTAYL